MKNVRTILEMLAFLGLSVSGAYAQKTYIITKSGSDFSVTIAGGGVLGSPNATLQNKIDDIKANASGVACIIQFGDGTNTLDLGGGGSTIITFSGSWGTVTLTGKATSACTSSDGVIRSNSSIQIESKADITVTGNGAMAIYMNSGELTVSAGTMQTTGTNGIVIRCWTSGKTLTISGGTVQATGIDGRAVFLYAGNANISGGTVKATNSGGEAIRVMYFSTITISDNAIVSSDNTSSASGTIHLLSYSGSGNMLEIKGGTVENKASGGNAIYDESFQNVTISGGTVKATTGIYKKTSGVLTVSGGMILAQEGYAIENSGSGTLTISGGIGFAYGAAVTDVIKGTFTVPPINSAVLVAWNKDAGNTTYEAGSSDDIFVLPTTITAIWANQGGSGGILGTLGSITGFIPIEGVTVSGTGVADISLEKITIYPNPVKDELQIESGEVHIENVKIYDINGRNIANYTLSTAKSIDVSYLPSGTYFLKMQTASGELVKKVIKE